MAHPSAPRYEKYGGANLAGRTSAKLMVVRRMAKTRRTVEFDTQRLRARVLSGLNDLFDLASALAKGKTKTLTEGGVTVKVTLK